MLPKWTSAPKASVWSLLAALLLPGLSRAETPQPARVDVLETPLIWQTDYDDAYRSAQEHHRLLLIYFQAAPQRSIDQTAAQPNSAPPTDPVLDTLAHLAADTAQQDKLKSFDFVRLPLDAATSTGKDRTVLLQHPAFAELRGGPGVAILDFAHVDQPYYALVVSALPLTTGKYYRFEPEHLPVLLDLPPGTLTHRTMIFAVRIHPEAPASTSGDDDPVLTDEAASHCEYQARVLVQGHQEWESRFHRIISRLLGRGRPGTPCEVVAESWPNQNLLDSCVDCVASWRQSPDHWSAVKAQHAGYSYDIHRGANGIWYATGIFAN